MYTDLRLWGIQSPYCYRIVLEQGQKILSGVSRNILKGHRTWQGATLLGLWATGLGIPVYNLKLQVIVLEILMGVVRG